MTQKQLTYFLIKTGKLSKRLSEHFYLTALDSDDNFNEDRLLILDEISYCPAALHILSSYTEEHFRE